MGTPTKYTPEFCDKAREFSKTGTTNQQLADALGIGKGTVDRWIVRYPEFKAAVEEGRGVADKKVELSLYQKACGGYTYTEKKEHRNAKGEVTRVEVNHKTLAPDTLAIIFWLKNRQPELWRDRREYDMPNVASDLAERLQRARDMSDESRAGRIAELLERARTQQEYEERLEKGDLTSPNKVKTNGSEKPVH